MADGQVSVVVIFLGAQRFLEEAIESVLAQTYPSWELLLVDDGSTDGSSAIARRYAAEHPGRIRYLEHPGHANRGTGPSRHLGLVQAKGEFIAFLDSDDIWLPRRLERHIALLRRQPDVAMVYGPTLYWFDWPGAPRPRRRSYVGGLWLQPNRRYHPPGVLTRFLTSRGGAVPGIGSFVARRSTALAVGGFEGPFHGTFEDQAFLSRICLSYPVYVLGELLDLYRQHPDSLCARSVASGGYHPKRPNQDYFTYLRWLEATLLERGSSDTRLWRALRWRLLPYHRPALSPLLYLGYRVKDACNRIQRSLTSLSWRRGHPPMRIYPAMAEPPLVSAVIIFLDAERFLEEAIRSVLGQTYPNWELLLVDDGSSDRSTGIARRYAAEHPGRIRCLEHAGRANRGMSASRNLGIAEARGTYVAFLDADDIWLPQRLERHVAVLETHRDVAMVYGPTLHWFGWTGDPVDAERDRVSQLSVEAERCYEPRVLLTRFLELANGSQPGICSILLRREAALEIGGFEDQFRNLFEDQVFLAKMCLHKPVYVVAECLDRYRQHPDSYCSVAQRLDGYDPDRPNPMQRIFLEWLEGYLAERGIADVRLWKALRFQLHAWRSPWRYWIGTAPRRLPYALKQTLRRHGLLPPPRRRRPATL